MHRSCVILFSLTAGLQALLSGVLTRLVSAGMRGQVRRRVDLELARESLEEVALRVREREEPRCMVCWRASEGGRLESLRESERASCAPPPGSSFLSFFSFAFFGALSTNWQSRMRSAHPLSTHVFVSTHSVAGLPLLCSSTLKPMILCLFAAQAVFRT